MEFSNDEVAEILKEFLKEKYKIPESTIYNIRPWVSGQSIVGFTACITTDKGVPGVKDKGSK